MVRGNGIKRSETIEKGCPCLRYGEIYTSYNVILDEPKSFVAKELFDRSVKIKKGDLVFTLTGENTEEIAKALAYLGDDEIAAGGDLAVWTGHGCDSKYLAYLMYSPQLISQKAATGNGNIVVHTSIKKLQQLEIPLPPLSVQREIVARLERELAAVEKMKKGFETLAETARAEFKAELKEVFEELKRSTETCRLGDLCKIKAGKKDVRQGNPHGEYPFFTCAKTCTFADTYSYDCAALLVAGNGDVGYTQKYVGKFEVYQRTYVLYDFKDVDIDFVYYLMTGEFQEWAYSKLMGNTMPYIKMGVLSEFQVPVPSLSVQHHTVSCLASAKAHAKFMEAKAREGVDVCETMRKAILKEAFESGVKEEAEYG